MPKVGLGPTCSARMTGRGVLGVWQGTCPGPDTLAPVGVPGAQLSHQPFLSPFPCHCP